MTGKKGAQHKRSDQPGDLCSIVRIFAVSHARCLFH